MEVNGILQRFKSQKHLAKLLNVSDSTVAQWKRRNAIPSNRIQQILGLAKTEHLELSPVDFFPNNNDK